MKKIALLLLLLSVTLVKAQTSDTLFYERFETGGNSFTLNTADMGGVNAATGYNQWIVNNSYTGGSGQLVCAGFPTTFTIPDNQLQPSGVTGGPSTNFMHISSDAAQASNIFNNSFLAANGLCGGNESYFTAMNQDVSSTGYSIVTLSFWWMCGGGNNSFGEVYYSIDGGINWVLANTSPTAYINQNTWVQEVITLPAFAGQTTLRFGFRFVNNITFSATDPAFGIDEVFIDGETLSAPPVAAFGVSDSSICEGGCVDFTDLSTGDPTSWLWIFQGASTGFSTVQNPTQICYSNPGNYTVTLIAGSAAGSDTLTINTVVVNANPAAPLLTSVGDTLTATPGFISYTWYRDSVLLVSSSSNEYISTQNGTYYVTVTDSNGCSSSSTEIILNTSIWNVETLVAEIYPNPVIDQLYLKNNGEIIELTIYNSLGAVIFKAPYGTIPNVIDLSLFEDGIYFIIIKDRNQNIGSRKIIKLR